MKNSAIFPASLALMAMATSLASVNPKQYDNVNSPSTPAADWTTRMFVQKDCLEPAEGDAYFDDLAAHQSPPDRWGSFCSVRIVGQRATVTLRIRQAI